MAKSLISLALLLTLLSCQKYHYLTEKEMDGVQFESNNHVYQLQLKIEAIATCSSAIVVTLNNKEKLNFPIQSELDTVLSFDWYNTPLYVEVDYDSCITTVPKVGVLLAE